MGLLRRIFGDNAAPQPEHIRLCVECERLGRKTESTAVFYGRSLCHLHYEEAIATIDKSAVPCVDDNDELTPQVDANAVLAVVIESASPVYDPAIPDDPTPFSDDPSSCNDAPDTSSTDSVA